MAFARPLYMAPTGGDPEISYAAQQDRGGLLSSLFSREGVLDVDAGDFAVTQRAAGANMSIDIAPGRAAVFGDDVSDQGAYLIQNTTIHNLSTFAGGGAITAPGSGTRIHRLVAQVRDKLHNGTWTTYDWLPLLLQDTGSGTPALPSSAISLALISISAGQGTITNAAITDARARASVGTRDRGGTFLLHADLLISDPSRPPRWQVNSDGRVQLNGWVSRSSAGTYNALQQYTITDIAFGRILPAAIRPSSIRDSIIACGAAPAHLAIQPNGEIKIRFWTTVANAGDWYSFDGVSYLIQGT